MSVAAPQNRQEFKEYILTRLGKPVLEINVADEQMDIAIEDAFQYFNERNHFNGVERVYLTTQITQDFKNQFRSFDPNFVEQESAYEICGSGMVEELQLENPGSGYGASFALKQVKTGSNPVVEFDIGTEPGDDVIGTDPDGNLLHVNTTTAGNGTGMTVYIDKERTSKCGILSVKIYNPGTGYEVGDYVAIGGSSTGDPAVFIVTKTKDKTGNFPIAQINEQMNFITLPKDVVGVTKILRSSSSFGLGGGIIPPGMIYPNLWGQISGDACNQAGFGLVSYYAMMTYMAMIEFFVLPPKMYNFNQRTHHLHIDGDLGDIGAMLCLECMVKPSPDVYPDLWNDMWLKEFATALVKAQWGRNLTKYNQVQLPGGIVMNGERILTDAQNELKLIKDRFSMDWMDPPLDEVG